MTDLAAFAEFFRSMGVEFHEALGETLEVLTVGDAEYQFERGIFIGIATDEDFIGRIAPEGG